MVTLRLFALLSLTLCLCGGETMAQRARCGTPPRLSSPPPGFSGLPSDCGYATNNPQPEDSPTFFYDIPVVFHVIQNSSGKGFLDPATIQDQIDVLNQDFQALPGSPGAPGSNGQIRFHLTNSDPAGLPTSGITYTTNDLWYQDSGNYWTPLAWDTNRFLNVYTNSPPCCFGYVPGFPTQGFPGQADDRVVLWWQAVGKNPTSGWPLNMGRTATHEIGHYLGLYHTFEGGCGSTSGCNTAGDLICDTNPQALSSFGCPVGQSSCGSPDPVHDYMDYSDDPCLWNFTSNQIQRMRCTLQHWRPALFQSVSATQTVRNGTPPNPTALLPGLSSAPIAAQTWNPFVDHSSFEPGASVDWLLVSLSPVNVTLGPKGTLLCGAPFLFMLPGPPGVPFSIPVPNDGNLLGIPFCAQAASTSGGGPIRLSNALDCVIGNGP